AASAQSTVLLLRVRNTSLSPWQLKPLLMAGVHLGCHVYDEQDQVVDVIKTGLRDGVVPTGGSVDITLVIPPLRKPGRYRLQLDMVDEQQCWFYQTGSEPLEIELRVREHVGYVRQGCPTTCAWRSALSSAAGSPGGPSGPAWPRRLPRCGSSYGWPPSAC